MIERVDALAHAFLVDVHPQIDITAFGNLIAERVGVAKLESAVDMQQGDRGAGREKRLAHQVQQNRAVLADGIQQHRIAELGGDFAEDVQAFRFQPVEMG